MLILLSIYPQVLRTDKLTLYDYAMNRMIHYTFLSDFSINCTVIHNYICIELWLCGHVLYILGLCLGWNVRLIA